jgi:hypothetical protein
MSYEQSRGMVACQLSSPRRGAKYAREVICRIAAAATSTGDVIQHRSLALESIDEQSKHGRLGLVGVLRPRRANHRNHHHD